MVKGDVVENSSAGVVCAANDPDRLASAVMALKMTDGTGYFGAKRIECSGQETFTDVDKSIGAGLVDLNASNKLPPASRV
jgi:hypothetical protein